MATEGRYVREYTGQVSYDYVLAWTMLKIAEVLTDTTQLMVLRHAGVEELKAAEILAETFHKRVEALATLMPPALGSKEFLKKLGECWGEYYAKKKEIEKDGCLWSVPGNTDYEECKERRINNVETLTSCVRGTLIELIGALDKAGLLIGSREVLSNV